MTIAIDGASLLTFVSAYIANIMSISGHFEGLYVASSVSALLFTFFSFIINYGREKHSELSALQKTVIRVVGVGLVSLSYIAETILVSLHRDGLHQIQNRLISTALLTLAWSLPCFRKSLLIAEILGLSLISLIFGIPLLVLDTLHRESVAESAPSMVIQSVRLLAVVGLLIDCIVCRSPRNDGFEVEEARLLDGTAEDTNSGRASYGTQPWAESDGDTSSSSGTDKDDEEEDSSKTTRVGLLRKSGSWMVYLNNFKVFLPYLIPKKDLQVQACLLICVICLIASRFLNILVPRQLGIVADKLFARELPYTDLVIYLALSLLVDDSGIGLIESLAKIPIEQFSYRQLTNAAFNHVMSLAMEFHSDRDSAEVMKAIEQGEALTNILETAVLNIIPTIIDMIVAFIFLYLKFNSSVALCMVGATLAFLSLEVVTSSWNIDNRRRLTKAEREEKRVIHQAVQGWQTVSVFNMFSYEKFRFGSAVSRHLLTKQDWSRRDAYITALLEGLVPLTFFTLASLVMNGVYHGQSSVGDFVFLIQYWDYLIWPIKYLSHEYRYLLRDLIDAEQLLDLLTTKPTVADKENALSLGHVEGRVEFEHVEFCYDTKRIAIRDVNIYAAPGETIALVGATGAGKSSLMKLLLRFFDVTSGSIKIDGHDVRDVTQGSLRDALGVVPQDALLFNTSIIENLRYAKLSASDEEIYEACRAAAIHDKILTFTDGYNTKVGEQGVKLSGGEIQRLAIARVFLKNPPILILDEATSAVDTETESEIQAALYRLARKRTTFVVAHRLSTIIKANQVLVVHDGTIVERGTHTELLEKGGKYYNLWQKQFGFPQDQEALLDL